jgi:NlpE N-terminal domain
MKLIKLAPLAVVGLFALVGCGPEGKYTLDKEATKAAIDAGEGEKDAKEFGKAMLEAMDMSIELKSGGKYDATSTVEMKKGEKKEETESGDWSKEGDKITIKGKKDPMTCTLDSGKLNCGKDGKTAFVFKKG